MMKKFDITKVNLYSILRDVVINLWVIALAAVTVFAGSYSYMRYVRQPQYTSRMTVAINLSGYTTSATALSLARTVVIAETLDDVFKSDALREVVAHDLEREITGTISAAQMGDTNLIQVAVSDTTPQKAYETLLSVQRNYTKVTDYVFSNVIIRTVVNPQMPSSTSNAMSPFVLSALIAILVGAAVTVLVVLFSYWRDTVKSVADVESELDARLFGTVPKVRGLNPKLPQSKRRLMITNPLVGFEFANSFRKMAIKLESLRRTKSAKVFMVTSVTENEGKPSTVINLAIALSQNNHRVLLGDCDFKNPSVRRFFDNVTRPENSDFHQYLDNGGDITHYIKYEPDTGIYLLDSVEHCTNSSEKLASKRFRDVINALKEQFDFVIIDTPPCGITIDPEVVSDVADAALLVIRQDVVSVTDINDQIENINKCYLAGCILNDFMQIGNAAEDPNDSYSNYYSRQNG